MKDTAFPFFQNLLHGSSFKPLVVNNGVIDQNPQNLFRNINGSSSSNLSSSPQINLGHFITDSLFALPNNSTSNNNNNIFHGVVSSSSSSSSSSKGGHDLNIDRNFASSSYGHPLARPSAQNGILHGIPSSKPYWGSQALMIQAPQQQPAHVPHHHHHHHQTNVTNPSLTLIKDLGSTKGNLPVSDPDHDPHDHDLDKNNHASCISTPDQKGQQKRSVAAQRKRRRLTVVRKPTKAQKKPSVVKGQWTPQEDGVLMQLVKRHGTRKWSEIAKTLTGRVGKQCRERWHNHLRPEIRKDTWSEEEDKILIRAHRVLGNKWAEIARRLPGRSENTIKNHWNATKRRQNTKRRNNTNANGNILQNYIRSLTTNQNDNNKNNSYDDIDVDENDNGNGNDTDNNTSSADHDDDDDQDQGRGVSMQLLSENNSDVTSVDNWSINPVANLVYGDNINGGANNGGIYINLDDKSLYSENCGFWLDDMTYAEMAAAMERESNVDFQMRSEIESLMKGPCEVKKEMGLMEMIYQGKI
ncbi:hypothetical protein TIFTF001_011745 [Ficus carica]|uniref:Uncharacterized protein n=1 Tax=Ficus carica TaxID=3494 RepID=A0AA88D351_FICCA|nr:hypothetical protein TIFTF001_011745 [Ficus carica]